MAAGIVSTPKPPIEINVKQDSLHKIKINLVKTGDVVGKINFQNINDDRDSLRQVPLIFVKFQKDSESFITKVNEKGEFCYKEILPGEWKVSVWLPNQQEQYSIENPEQIIQVMSSQTNRMSFSVTSKERKIRFSDKTFQLHVKSK